MVGIARTIVGVSIALTGCYSPSARDCSYTCNAGACPSGLTCVNSFCRDDPHPTDTCVPGDGGAGDGGASAYASLIMEAMPIAYWRLGGTNASTGTANEVMGSPAADVISGAPTFGQIGATPDGNRAVGFEKNNSDCLSAAQVPGSDFGPGTHFTIEAWVRPTIAVGAMERTMLSKVVTNPTLAGFVVILDSNNTAQLHTCSNGSCDVVTAVALPALQWTHLVATYNGPTPAGALYIDGSHVATSTLTYPAAITGAPILLGCQPGAFYFDGALDEVAIYARLLTATEIAAHFQAGRGL